MQRLHNAYTLMVANGIFPVHELMKGHQTLRVHNQLMQSQWWPYQEILELQKKKLYRFMFKVATEAPFYKRCHEFLPASPDETFDAFSHWPLLTKEDIRNNFEAFKVGDDKELSIRATGGSTGEPFKFMIPKERFSHDVAAKWRATRWWGVDIGDKELVIWGSPIEEQAQNRIKQVRDFLLRSRFFSAHGLNEHKAIEILKTIESYKPKMLFSYPSILHYLAQVAQEFGLSENLDSVKVAFVTSEMLEPFQEALISEVFNCPVANGYGGRDAGFIAHACQEGRLHISAEDILVEIVDDCGNLLPEGEVGEIVVTHLATRAFPFARYKTGDHGAISLSGCPCGRHLPVLEKLEGRISDLIYARHGDVVHRNEIIQIINQTQGIRQFRFEQMSLENSVLSFTGDISPTDESKIKHGLINLLGHRVTIDINHVEHLEQCDSGKHRFIVSHVNHKQQTTSLRNSA